MITEMKSLPTPEFLIETAELRDERHYAVLSRTFKRPLNLVTLALSRKYGAQRTDTTDKAGHRWRGPLWRATSLGIYVVVRKRQVV